MIEQVISAPAAVEYLDPMPGRVVFKRDPPREIVNESGVITQLESHCVVPNTGTVLRVGANIPEVWSDLKPGCRIMFDPSGVREFHTGDRFEVECVIHYMVIDAILNVQKGEVVLQ